MKIDKDRKYTTRDGKEVRIYATDGGGNEPVHGGFKVDNEDDLYHITSWSEEGCYHPTTEHNLDLIEALKPTGIPVDLPDPPEVEGYSWEARGWGWKLSVASRGKYIGFFRMENETWNEFKCRTPEGRGDTFYIEYIPISSEEMTLAQVCKELGKNIKIIK